MTSSLLWKASFWTLVLATLWLSLVPVDQIPSAFSFWDKAQHALGFAGLGFLGLMAYPHRLLRIPLMADTHSTPIADSVPRDGGHPVQEP